MRRMRDEVETCPVRRRGRDRYTPSQARAAKTGRRWGPASRLTPETLAVAIRAVEAADGETDPIRVRPPEFGLSPLARIRALVELTATIGVGS